MKYMKKWLAYWVIILKNKENILNVLGLAYRARKLITGYDPVLRVIRNNKVNLVFIASDASDKTKDTFRKKCFFYNVPINFSFNCDELSNYLGKKLVKIAAICDKGFYDVINKLIEVN